MTDGEFASCKQYTDDELVCSNPKQVFSSAHRTCEFDIFTRQYPVRECATRKTSKTDIWLETDKNNWFFMIANVTTLTSICGDKLLRHEFHGCGVLSLRSSCILKGDSVQIFGIHEIAGMDITLSPIPEIWNDELNEPIRILYPALQSHDLNITGNLTTQIRELQNQIRDPIRLNYHDIHHYGITYIWILCCIVIFIFILKKLDIPSIRLIPMPNLPPPAENVA